MPFRWPVLQFPLGAAGFLVLGGCKPAETPTTPPEPSAAAAVVPNPSLPEPRQDLPTEQRTPDLFGAWRVEAVAAPDPRTHHESMDMLLLVGNRQLEILSQCITVGPFDYARTVGGGIAISLPAVQPRRPNDPRLPPPVRCTRTLSPAEQPLGPILMSARTVRLQADGRVTVSGSAGSLTLRRVGVLANPRGHSPPPSTPPLLGAWQVLSVDGRSMAGSSQRMELLLRPDYIEWRSGCVNSVKRMTRDRDMLIRGETDPFPVCERGETEAETAMLRLLNGPIGARMRRDFALTLSGSGVTAELAPLNR